jgi:MoxR-like ATPase
MTDTTTAARAIAQFLRAAEGAYPERGPTAAAICLAAVARSNALLIGPPGSAKTALAVRTLNSLFGSRPFCATLSPYSTDDQLLGPVDLAALQRGVVARSPGDYLPQARAAFVDEVSRGSAAVRALLLSALADRELDGAAIPLEVVIGATNFLLGDEAEQAFMDRFAVRVTVDYINGPETLGSFLAGAAGAAIGAGTAPTLPDVLPDVLPALRAAADAAQIPPDVLAAVGAVAVALRTRDGEGPRPSDRRLRWLCDHLRARCAMRGADVVTFEDLAKVAPMILAADAGEAAIVAGAVRAALPAHLDALDQYADVCRDALRAAREVSARIERGEAVTDADAGAALRARRDIREGADALAGAHPIARADAERIRDDALAALASV